MERITFKVTGMSCGHCVNSIEGSVRSLTGISDVSVHLSEGKVEVTFVPGEINVITIKKIIEDQGYEVA